MSVAPHTPSRAGFRPIDGLLKKLSRLPYPAAARGYTERMQNRFRAIGCGAHDEVDLFTFELVAHRGVLRTRNNIYCNETRYLSLFTPKLFDPKWRELRFNARLPVGVLIEATRLRRLQPIGFGIVLGRHFEQRVARRVMETAGGQPPADQGLLSV